MTLEEVELAIYHHYQVKTEEIIRLVGRDNYIRKPVHIVEVGTLAELWALWEYLNELENAA